MLLLAKGVRLFLLPVLPYSVSAMSPSTSFFFSLLFFSFPPGFLPCTVSCVIPCNTTDGVQHSTEKTRRNCRKWGNENRMGKWGGCYCLPVTFWQSGCQTVPLRQATDGVSSIVLSTAVLLLTSRPVGVSVGQDSDSNEIAEWM